MSLLNLPRVGGCGCAVVGYTRTYTQMPTHTHTRIRFKNDELYQCYVAAWNGDGFGGEWIHVYVWLRPFTVHLKLSQHVNHLYNSTNKKVFFFN